MLGSSQNLGEGSRKRVRSQLLGTTLQSVLYALFLLPACASKMETTHRTSSCLLLGFESKAYKAISHWHGVSHLSTPSCKGGWKRDFAGFYLGEMVLTMWEAIKIKENVKKCWRVKRKKKQNKAKNRGSTTVRGAWLRYPNFRKTWAQSGWAHPRLALGATVRLDTEWWTLGLTDQRVAICDDQEAAESWLVNPDAQKPLH